MKRDEFRLAAPVTVPGVFPSASPTAILAWPQMERLAAASELGLIFGPDGSGTPAWVFTEPGTYEVKANIGGRIYVDSREQTLAFTRVGGVVYFDDPGGGTG